MKNKEAIRNITTVLSEGLTASFKDEKARLYEVFGTGWVASADLWETDMLCVLWAFGGSKVDGGPLLDCSLIGDEVKSELGEFQICGLLTLDRVGGNSCSEPKMVRGSKRLSIPSPGSHIFGSPLWGRMLLRQNGCEAVKSWNELGWTARGVAE